MPNRFQKAIRAFKDQTSISLAKVNGSSNLQIAVLKATSHDDLPIDEHYVQQILQLISSNKAYASACAKAIRKRITRTHNWIVALKSLTLVLRIFQDGDPYFPTEILRSTKKGGRVLNLSGFCDYSSSTKWDYTGFVRRFGLYLEERLDCILTGKLQRRYTYNEKKGPCNRSKNRTNDYIPEMKPGILVDRIVYWQRLLDRAIAITPDGFAKDNHQLVKISVYSVVRESFDLYRDISDGLSFLLNNLLKLKSESWVRVYEICVKAEKQFEELDGFYSVCKTVGVGSGLEYPRVETVNGELVERLQEFLKDKTAFHTDKTLHESFEQESEFSGFSLSTGTVSDKASESGSECGSISNDLEAYSGEYEKRSKQEPISDLISFDDWPADNERKEIRQATHTVTLYNLQFRSQPCPINRYNPFLQDLYDIPADNSCIASYWAEHQTAAKGL